MRRTREQNAITLVALIITIIILLILAVVARRAITGDGILQKAREASDTTTRGQIQEELDLVISNLIMEETMRNNMSQEEKVQWLQSELQKQDGNAEVNTNGNGFTGNYKDHNFSVNEDYKVTIGDYAQNDNNNSNENNNDNVDNSQGGNEENTDNNNNNDNSANEPEESIIKPQIGDKVAYDEGSGKTSGIDSNFVMEDMEWRILDIEDDGRIELISTQPTTSRLRLFSKYGWLRAEIDLDKLCNNLYANGTGVTARNLKVEDIDKLAGITTDEDKKAITSKYGSLWQYQYSQISGYMQYRTSTNKGLRWTNWTNITNSTYQQFEEPDGERISSSKYKDSYGNQIIKELEYTDYGYNVSSKIVKTTSDGISMADLITQGLNDTNNETLGSFVGQWLSSCSVYCDYNRASFYVRTIVAGDVSHYGLWSSYGESNGPSFPVRPVVTLPSSVTLTNVDGVWQVNI